MNEAADVKKLTIVLTPETHKTLRVEAAVRDTSMQKLAATCLNDCARRLAAETANRQH